MEDIALACVAVINENAKNKIFTIAGEKSITIEELAYTVKNIVNPAIEIILKEASNREDDYLGQINNLEETFENLVGNRG